MYPYGTSTTSVSGLWLTRRVIGRVLELQVATESNWRGELLSAFTPPRITATAASSLFVRIGHDGSDVL